MISLGPKRVKGQTGIYCEEFKEIGPGAEASYDGNLLYCSTVS